MSSTTTEAPPSGLLGPDGQPWVHGGDPRRSTRHGYGVGRGPYNAYRTPYRAAGISRQTQHWQPGTTSGDVAIFEGWSLQRARARDLIRNDPFAQAILREFLLNVIGNGIGSRATALDDKGEPLTDFNDEADALWAEYAEGDVDYLGECTLPEMQRVILEEMIVPGESLLVQTPHPDPDRDVPISWQLVEPEQLNTHTEGDERRPADHEIYEGVEYDPAGRKVAYWFFAEHPGGPSAMISDRTVRIDAGRVLHTFKKERPSQSRGASWFAPILTNSHDLDRYLAHEMQSAALSAMFSMIIKSDDPGRGLGIFHRDESGENQPIWELGAGQLINVGTDGDAQGIESDRPRGSATPWLKLFQTMQSAGVGMSYLAITRDYSQTSYSSSRAAGNADRKQWRQMQRFQFEKTGRPMRRRWTREMVARGRFRTVEVGEFNANPRRYLALAPRFDGWAEVDPDKETKAARQRLAAGLSSYSDELDRTSNRDVREHAKDVARDLEIYRRAEIPTDLFGQMVQLGAEDE